MPTAALLRVVLLLAFYSPLVSAWTTPFSSKPQPRQAHVTMSASGTGKGVLFICLGNICRSPSAEAVMKAVVEKEGKGGWVLGALCNGVSWRQSKGPSSRHDTPTPNDSRGFQHRQLRDGRREPHLVPEGRLELPRGVRWLLID